MKLSHAATAIFTIAYYSTGTNAFVTSPSSSSTTTTTTTRLHSTVNTDTAEEIRIKRKQELLGLLGSTTKQSNNKSIVDPVLADPISKLPLKVETMGAMLAGDTSPGVKVSFTTEDGTDVFMGRTNTFYNLLEPQQQQQQTSSSSSPSKKSNPALSLDTLRVFIPPPLRSAMATAGVLQSDDYVPMRDLFTSPSVSFAYERGWRQGFAQAGFPGADEEYDMVRKYFEDVTKDVEGSTVVDMSCATGLFTRRLAKSNDYNRVIACDYSESMLQEARRRINSDPSLQTKSSTTKLDLVRCDVAKIPMRTSSIDALHAGAAMHCWPDLDAGLGEIYRVLKPGGRYFATTFLSTYFGGLQTAEGGQTGVNRQAFQYFESVDVLRSMLVKAGFENEKVSVEVLEPACVIIKCEK